MDFEDIVRKYNYSRELAEFLKQIYDEFVREFGKEVELIIYEAFLNTLVVSCDNIYLYLKSRGLLDNQVGDSLVSEGELRMATGVYHSYPIIQYNEDKKEYMIVDVVRVVAINNLDLSKNYIKGALIHELGHMVKAFYKEFSIEGNILTTRSGLIETKEELSYENNCVIRRLVSEKSVGLEEGLNAVLERDIARRIVEADYEIHGYGVVHAVARNFTKKDELKQAILNAQMLKDKDRLIDFFNNYFAVEYSYETLEALVDKMYVLGLRQFAAMFNPDRMHAIARELDDVIINEYNPFLDKLSEARLNKGREVA